MKPLKKLLTQQGNGWENTRLGEATHAQKVVLVLSRMQILVFYLLCACIFVGAGVYRTPETKQEFMKGEERRFQGECWGQ